MRQCRRTPTVVRLDAKDGQRADEGGAVILEGEGKKEEVEKGKNFGGEASAGLLSKKVDGTGYYR